MSVAVIKLGVGNTASVMFALERLGARATLTDDLARIDEAERVILPGVGVAAHAMCVLRDKEIGAALRAFARPLLGICLGQQVLYESSEEGDVETLGLLPGAVTRLPASIRAPAPNMGWSQISLLKPHALLEGVREGDYAYFVHSYICPLGEEALASATYNVRFAAVVARGNVFGCQFHPERSATVGARILANFLRLPC